jgi:hypothetical protein
MPGKWGIGRASDVPYTRGIGTCIGIAVYDPATTIGYIAHVYSTEGSQRAVLKPLTDLIRLHSEEPPSLIGWVTGDSSEANAPKRLDPELLLRAKVLSRLDILGLSPENLHVDWNDDERLLVAMSLDCASGEYAMAKTPIP